MIAEWGPGDRGGETPTVMVMIAEWGPADRSDAPGLRSGVLRPHP